MTTLEIRLLGPPQATLGGEPVTIMRSDKVLALLSYLAVEADQPQRREKLAGLLWPDFTESSARTNLRRALADLRKSIGDDQASPSFLLVTRQTIQFNRDSDSWLDVSHFKSLSLSKLPDSDHSIQDQSSALNLYKGDFMEGFSLPDSSPFEEWLLLTRQQLRREFLETSSQLVDTLEAHGEIELALPFAWRQLEVDPARESTHRQLMRLLALNGQRDTALAQYETCSKSLSTELGVEPAPETQQLYLQILRGEWPPVSTSEGDKTRHPPRQIGECPYLGLASFQEDDAAFFFGRESFVDQLLESIQKQPGLTAVLGSSGSGKSSVVQAGLLPRLRVKGDWMIVPFRPGSNPFYALSAAIVPHIEPDLSETDRLIELQKLAAVLENGVVPLNQLLERVMQLNPLVENLLLYIDQFEELYTLVPGLEVRQRFLDELILAADQNHESSTTAVHFLLAMRIDFMGQAMEGRSLANLLQDHSLLLGPMTKSEMRAAIEEPAILQGAAFEDGLVNRLLNDIGDEPGRLPLLEFALTLLWEHADHGWLTHNGYDRIGHVHGALAHYADQVYDDLEEPNQLAAPHVFLQLVHPWETTKDTRRRATKAEIGEANWPLVQHLADKRLVVTGKDSSGMETAELVHEALINHWGRLKGWIETERDFRTWQETLRDSIRQWDMTNQDDGALLRGVPLAEALAWAEKKGDDLGNTETEYIEASSELQYRQQRERNRLRQRIIIGLSTGLVITIILAILAGIQWRRADQQRTAALQAQATAAEESLLTQRALSGLLAAQSRNTLDEQYDQALLLAVESLRRIDTIEGRGSLFNALNLVPNLSSYLHGSEDAIHSLAFHPERALLVSGDAAGTISLWNTESKQLMSNKLNNHQGPVSDLAFSPDGSILASSSFDDTLILWDADESSSTFGQMIIPPLGGHSGNVWSLAFSPDGTILASAGTDGEIFLWDMEQDSETFGRIFPNSLEGHDGIITSLAFSPDGAILASAGADKSIILWDVASGIPIRDPFIEHQAFISSLAFSPDGRRLASGGKDNNIQLWDVDPASPSFGQPLKDILSSHTDNIWDLTFLGDSNLLASSSEDGSVIVWNVNIDSEAFGEPFLPPLSGHSGSVLTLAYNPATGMLASGGTDKNIMLWHIAAENPIFHELVRVGDSTWWTVSSPDGYLLVQSENLGPIHLWDLNMDSNNFGEIVGSPLLGHTDWVNWAAFSPDSKIMASASDDETIILWNTDTSSASFGKPAGPPLTDHNSEVVEIVFDHEGKVLASADGDGFIQLWKVDPESDPIAIPLTQLFNKDIGIVYFMHFNPEGTILAAMSIDGKLYLWDVGQDSPTFGEQLTHPMIGIPGRSPFRYSPDGALIAAGYEDGSIRLWIMDQDSEKFGDMLGQPLQEHNSTVTDLVFSPNGKYLVSADITGKVLLWDLTTSRAVDLSEAIFWGEGSFPVALFFRPEDDVLIVSNRDARVFQWDLNIESWIDTACQRTHRNLTIDEWKQIFGDEPYQATCPDLPLPITERND